MSYCTINVQFYPMISSLFCIIVVIARFSVADSMYLCISVADSFNKSLSGNTDSHSAIFLIADTVIMPVCLIGYTLICCVDCLIILYAMRVLLIHYSNYVDHC